MNGKGKAKFKMGRVVATRGVDERLQTDAEFRKFVHICLGRHVNADWGDLASGDARLNEESLKSGEGRLFSSYIWHKDIDERIWIITEWDRSVTTILFPKEY